MAKQGGANALSNLAKSNDAIVPLRDEQDAAFDRRQIAFGTAGLQPTADDFSRIVRGAERTHRSGVQLVQPQGIFASCLAQSQPLELSRGGR